MTDPNQNEDSEEVRKEQDMRSSQLMPLWINARNAWAFATTILLVFVCGAMYQVYHDRNIPTQAKVIANGKVISVLLARDSKEWSQGLSGHAPLKENEGMLFVFDHPNSYGFWMKDMLFALDIVWMRDDGTIIGIERDFAPESLPEQRYPKEPVALVLEVPAGTANRLGLEIGSTLRIDPPSLIGKIRGN
jgi:uncharacterized membrane protein (UPF0127 family)